MRVADGRLRAGATALVLVLVASVARAAAAQEDPRALFEQGIRAIDESRFADAIRLLEQSQRLRASAVVTYNLGVAYRAVGRFREAVTAFEQYLVSPPRSATPEDLTRVRAELGTLRNQLVSLRVRVTPSNAELTLDGRVERPANGAIAIDPGAHTLEATAPRHQTARRSFQAVAGTPVELAIDLVADATTGRLSIQPSIASARVSVDGTLVGRGAVERMVEEGRHHVHIEADGHAPEDRNVTIVAGGAARLEVSLRPLGPPGWVLPVAIVGGVVIAGSITAAIVVAARPAAEYTPSPNTTWLGTVQEMRRTP
jgi:hypothetical protein